MFKLNKKNIINNNSFTNMHNQQVKNQIKSLETARTKKEFGIRASAACKPQGNNFFYNLKKNKWKCKLNLNLADKPSF